MLDALVLAGGAGAVVAAEVEEDLLVDGGVLAGDGYGIAGQAVLEGVHGGGGFAFGGLGSAPILGCVFDGGHRSLGEGGELRLDGHCVFS